MRSKLLLALLLVGFAACQDDQILDPNLDPTSGKSDSTATCDAGSACANGTTKKDGGSSNKDGGTKKDGGLGDGGLADGGPHHDGGIPTNLSSCGLINWCCLLLPPLDPLNPDPFAPIQKCLNILNACQGNQSECKAAFPTLLNMNFCPF